MDSWLTVDTMNDADTGRQATTIHRGSSSKIMDGVAKDTRNLLGILGRAGFAFEPAIYLDHMLRMPDSL